MCGSAEGSASGVSEDWEVPTTGSEGGAPTRS